MKSQFLLESLISNLAPRDVRFPLKNALPVLSHYDLDAFTRSYLIAALWSSVTGEEGTPMDSLYDLGDLSQDALRMARNDCAQFQRENAADIALGCTRGSGEYSVEEQAGHDFWLTRANHGCGFFDGDWDDEEGDDKRAIRLTDAAKAFGDCNLEDGYSDGKLHFDGENEREEKGAGLHYTQTGFNGFHTQDGMRHASFQGSQRHL